MQRGASHEKSHHFLLRFCGRQRHRPGRRHAGRAQQRVLRRGAAGRQSAHHYRQRHQHSGQLRGACGLRLPGGGRAECDGGARRHPPRLHGGRQHAHRHGRHRAQRRAGGQQLSHRRRGAGAAARGDPRRLAGLRLPRQGALRAGRGSHCRAAPGGAGLPAGGHGVL